MPALDASGADRIATFRTLHDSAYGTKSATIAALFGRTAEILKAEGYDRYSRTEDETANGLTLFEGIEQAAREEAERVVIARGLNPERAAGLIDREAEDLADELVIRLSGVLFTTGQIRSFYGGNDPTELVWHWTRAAEGDRVDMGARYRGIEHVTALLKLAAAMTVLIEA